MIFGRLPRIAVLVLALLVALVGFVPAANAAAKARTGVTINHKTITLGKSAVMRGKVSPAQPGQRVALQLRKGGTWKTVKRFTLNSASRYAFAVRPKSTGLKRYRVVDPATKGSASSVSRVVTLRVKAKPSGSSGGSSGGSQCTPGYSPCIPPASDVDCAGGSGNGPAYVDGPVYVTGSDPYGLDADGDGIGCD